MSTATPLADRKEEEKMSTATPLADCKEDSDSETEEDSDSETEEGSDSETEVTSANSSLKLPELLATIASELIAAVKYHNSCKFKNEKAGDEAHFESVMCRHDNTTMERSAYLSSQIFIRGRRQTEAMIKVLQLRRNVLKMILRHKNNRDYLESVRTFPWHYMEEKEKGYSLFFWICGDESNLYEQTQRALEKAISGITAQETEEQERLKTLDESCYQ